MERHAALEEWTEARCDREPELEADRGTLQGVFAVGTARRRLAVEGDAVETGVRAEDSERQADVGAVAESLLGALDERGARARRARIVGERSSGKAPGSAQSERDRLRLGGCGERECERNSGDSS